MISMGTHLVKVKDKMNKRNKQGASFIDDNPSRTTKEEGWAAKTQDYSRKSFQFTT